MSARWIGSETSGRAASSSIRARSTRPASQAFSAAAVRRRARCSSSGVSAAARSKASEAAAKPLRRRARWAACSSSSTTDGSGSTLAAARCQARRSASTSPSSTLRERAMGGLPLRERRRLIDGGANERVAKLEPRSSHVREPGLLGAVERLGRSSELRGRAQHGRELAAVVRGGDEQKRLRLLRQPMHARKEGVLDAGADRYRPEQRLGARKLRLAQGRGELEQRERVAARLRDEPVANVCRECDARVAIDQRGGRRRVEPAQVELREPGRLEAANLALAGGEKHGDALCLEPPGDEDERVRGCVVEPLRIVDEAEERLALGGLGEQAQRCEPRRGSGRLLPAPARALREGQRPAVAGCSSTWREDRADDLVQGGERKVRLGFDSAAAQNEHAARPGRARPRGAPTCRRPAHRR